jgi:hypothetical protein
MSRPYGIEPSTRRIKFCGELTYCERQYAQFGKKDVGDGLENKEA